MNKKDFLTCLQCALFSFEGATNKEILQLNPNYPKELIIIGSKIAKQLKVVEIKCYNVKKGDKEINEI